MYKPILLDMGTRARLLMVFACGACVLLCSLSLPAQLPPCMKARSPFPTLAEEIADMKAEVEGPHPIVIIDVVHFDGPIHLSRSALSSIIRTANQAAFSADDDWLEEFQDVALRGWWQDHGYNNVKVTAESHLNSGDSQHQHFSVSVHVDEGLQYRLSGIRFVNADPERGLAIPEEQLRKVIQIRDGEILNVDKVRRGVEALTRFYGTKGYMDFTAEPRLETDDAHRRISVLMRLSEQKQYIIAKVDVLSQNPELEKDLKSTIKAGDVCNSKLMEDFFTKHKSILPPDSSPMTSIKVERNVKTGTVNLVFDFWDPCAPRAD